MNVLITGARGQLGHELERMLSSGMCELGEVPEAFEEANLVLADVEELDISDRIAVESFLKQGCFDLVFNCAAVTNVDGCERNPEAAFRINSLGARNLAVACGETGTRLVHISTDYVFSGDGKVPYSEWDVCVPNSIYGKSKRLGEEYVMQFCRDYAVVRTSWLYGYVGNNFVKTILRKAKEGGPLKVVSDQRGNPTNAVDLAYHLLKIAASGERGIFHCTGIGECSWYEFAKAIVEYAELPVRVEPCSTVEYPSPVRRPAYSALDHNMLRATVGDGMREWHVALKSFINNYIQE